jgi:hypothetical protein
MISPLKPTEGNLMTTHNRFKVLSAMLGLVIAIATQNAFCASEEPPLEKITIPLSSETEFTFAMPMKSRTNLFLLRSKNKEARNSFIGKITITDEGCSLGHQVSIAYEKTRNEILTVYFPKEIPWGTTYKLRVRRDAKTLTVNLNGETISVTPYQKTKFIHFINNPEIINILNFEQN